MSIKPTFGFVVEYVPDIEAAKAFYEEVLGLEIERYHPTFVQFDTFAIASDEPMAESGQPELYWLVEDAEAAFTVLSQKAEVCLPLEQKPFGKVFAVKDPAGHPRYLLELTENRPSKSIQK